MGKKFEKFWNGAVGFSAVEQFSSLDAAVKASVPSDAAKIIIDNKTLSYDFKRIKEVDPNANALSTPGGTNPGKEKGEKKIANENK
tara:strand:+ start:2012 stop:2269 length:258 start_codon:yes stop_codon:yes gene_type:complete